jgi:hypothetical protein
MTASPHGRYPGAPPEAPAYRPGGLAGPGMSGAHPRGSGGRGPALPIAVACGLAVGVVGGLLLLRGADDADETAATQAGQGAQAVPDASSASPGAPADSRSDAAAQSGSPSAQSGSSAEGAPASAADQPSQSVAVVSFSVRPKRAHIFVNGTELDGASTDVELTAGSARIDVVIKSHGHRSHRETYTVTGDRTIEVALRKRSEPDGPGSMLDIR